MYIPSDQILKGLIIGHMLSTEGIEIDDNNKDDKQQWQNLVTTMTNMVTSMMSNCFGDDKW